VKLLFDQNLSHRLVEMLADIYLGSEHVKILDMHREPDAVIWKFAKENDFVIVSKDNDFHQRSFLCGWPPKVVWLRLGNCSTQDIEKCLRSPFPDLAAFEADQQAAFLSLG
jgi:predicted nuclease of predicted toxin-antitoxin system